MINSESTNEENTKTEKLVTLSTIAMCGIKLIKSMLKDEKIEKRNLLRLKKNRMMSDLLQNEQISNLAQKDAVENINNVNINKIDIDTKIENNKFKLSVTVPYGCEAKIVLPNGDTFIRTHGEYLFENDL